MMSYKRSITKIINLKPQPLKVTIWNLKLIDQICVIKLHKIVYYFENTFGCSVIL